MIYHHSGGSITVPMICTNHTQWRVFYLYDRAEHEDQYPYDPQKEGYIHKGHPEDEFCFACLKDWSPPICEEPKIYEISDPLQRVVAVLKWVDLITSDEVALQDLLRRMELAHDVQFTPSDRATLLELARTRWHVRLEDPLDAFPAFLAAPQDLSSVELGQEVVLREYSFYRRHDLFSRKIVEQATNDTLSIGGGVFGEFDRGGMPKEMRLRQRIYLPSDQLSVVVTRQAFLRMIDCCMEPSLLSHIPNDCLSDLYTHLLSIPHEDLSEPIELRQMHTLTESEMAAFLASFEDQPLDLSGVCAGQEVVWQHKHRGIARYILIRVASTTQKTISVVVSSTVQQAYALSVEHKRFSRQGFDRDRGSSDRLLLPRKEIDMITYRQSLLDAIRKMYDGAIHNASKEQLRTICILLQNFGDPVKWSSLQEARERA